VVHSPAARFSVGAPPPRGGCAVEGEWRQGGGEWPAWQRSGGGRLWWGGGVLGGGPAARGRSEGGHYKRGVGAEKKNTAWGGDSVDGGVVPF
jgi:hypothetical protein